LAGTIIVEVPSADGLARPVDELAGSSPTPWTDSGVATGDDCPVIGGDATVVPEPGLPTPVAPPMTPPLVGGFAAPVAALAGGGGAPEPAELFVLALFVGAPPPTAPAGAPPPTAPAGAPPPTAAPAAGAVVPIPPRPPPGPAAPAPAAPLPPAPAPPQRLNSPANGCFFQSYPHLSPPVRGRLPRPPGADRCPVPTSSFGNSAC
jgi:hypothetical protein